MSDLNARASEIEDAIAAGSMTPAQVFTQMRSLVQSVVREAAEWQTRYEYIRARYLSDDAEAPFLPDEATYASTPEEFDAAIDAATQGV
jgi:hypothetical protein